MRRVPHLFPVDYNVSPLVNFAFEAVRDQSSRTVLHYDGGSLDDIPVAQQASQEIGRGQVFSPDENRSLLDKGSFGGIRALPLLPGAAV